MSSEKKVFTRAYFQFYYSHMDLRTRQLQLYLPTAMLMCMEGSTHPHIHKPKMQTACESSQFFFIKRKSYMKAVVPNQYPYAITPNVSTAKLKHRLVFRAQNSSPWCPRVCLRVHAHDKERQIHKQLNSKGVCKRQDDDDDYCCGCFQGSWEAAVKRFISCERFQSLRVNKATWLVCKPVSNMPKWMQCNIIGQ